MTVEDAAQLVQAIREAAKAGDDEHAHSLEDDMRIAVLKEVANRNPDAVDLAWIALSTGMLTFMRNCA